MLTFCSKIPATSGFANFSSTSPFGTIGTGKSVFGAPLPSTTDSSSQQAVTQTSASAFKSSGFASLAGSASPFSTFASSSTSTFTQPPRATSPEKSVLPGITAAATDKPSGFAALSGPPSASPFGGAAGTSSFAKPGSMLFGGGFSGGFGGGSKLSSFAAPTGDIKLGAPKAKAFGASGGSDDEDSGSEAGDEEGDQSEKKEEEGSQFHVQEGKQTVASLRVPLLILRSSRHR
jgi:Ran-binding protein 3